LRWSMIRGAGRMETAPILVAASTTAVRRGVASRRSSRGGRRRCSSWSRATSANDHDSPNPSSYYSSAVTFESVQGECAACTPAALETGCGTGGQQRGASVRGARRTGILASRSVHLTPQVRS
jgi:hypothetical protein